MPIEITHSGPGHRDFVAFATRSKNARGYLEVGVCDGATLTLISCPSIGVDPNFMLTHNPASNKKMVHLYQMTSDEFFRQFDPRDILKTPIDVTFLDGLHQFEFLLRYFINTEAVSHRDSLIILDDCLPVNVEMTERALNVDERKNKERAWWWTGDVWKIIPILREYRPDLQIVCVDVQPTGAVCITNLDCNSNVLRRNYNEIVRKYIEIQMTEERFAEFYEKIKLVPGGEIMRGFEASLYLGP